MREAAGAKRPGARFWSGEREIHVRSAAWLAFALAVAGMPHGAWAQTQDLSTIVQDALDKNGAAADQDETPSPDADQGAMPGDVPDDAGQSSALPGVSADPTPTTPASVVASTMKSLQVDKVNRATFAEGAE